MKELPVHLFGHLGASGICGRTSVSPPPPRDVWEECFCQIKVACVCSAGGCLCFLHCPKIWRKTFSQISCAKTLAPFVNVQNVKHGFSEDEFHWCIHVQKFCLRDLWKDWNWVSGAQGSHSAPKTCKFGKGKLKFLGKSRELINSCRGNFSVSRKNCSMVVWDKIFPKIVENKILHLAAWWTKNRVQKSWQLYLYPLVGWYWFAPVSGYLGDELSFLDFPLRWKNANCLLEEEGGNPEVEKSRTGNSHFWKNKLLHSPPPPRLCTMSKVRNF